VDAAILIGRFRFVRATAVKLAVAALFLGPEDALSGLAPLSGENTERRRLGGG
jgi:hypothetical protein